MKSFNIDKTEDRLVTVVRNEQTSNSISGVKRGVLTLKKSANDDFAGSNSSSSDSKRIIIISHSYTPMLNPRAYRWTAIAERWAEEGKRVDVVCSWEAGLQSAETINGVHVHRVGSSFFEKLRGLLRSKERSSQSNLQAEETPALPSVTRSLMNNCRSAIKTIARIAHDVTWKNIYWPDYATLWAKPARQKVQAMINEIDPSENVTLITVSDPFTAHIAGRALKHDNPELNWIVDIGDPFCFRHDTPTNNHIIYGAFNYRYERKIFNEADSVSVTTDATKRQYAKLFPGSSEKIMVIPPLVALGVCNEGDELSAAPLGNSGAFKALFTGALYKTIRNPEYLLRLFAASKEMDPQLEIELHFFGPHSDCQEVFTAFESTLGKDVHLHGLMPKAITMMALRQADLLINIGNTSPYQLPSKVVEYACTEKPILNIASIVDDSSAMFFQGRKKTITINTADGRSLYDHSTELRTFLDDCQSSDNQSMLEHYRKHLIEAHGPKSITELYSSLLVGQTNSQVGEYV